LLSYKRAPKRTHITRSPPTTETRPHGNQAVFLCCLWSFADPTSLVEQPKLIELYDQISRERTPFRRIRRRTRPHNSIIGAREETLVPRRVAERSHRSAFHDLGARRK
jgi:hypothetical protein